MPTENAASSGPGPAQAGCSLVNLAVLVAAIGGFLAAGLPAWKAGGTLGLLGGVFLGLVGAVAATVLACAAVAALVGLLVLVIHVHDRYGPGYRRPVHRKLLRIRTLLAVVAAAALWLGMGRFLFSVYDTPGTRREALMMAVLLPAGLIFVPAAAWLAPMFGGDRPRRVAPERDNLGLHLRTPSGTLRRARTPKAGPPGDGGGRATPAPS